MPALFIQKIAKYKPSREQLRLIWVWYGGGWEGPKPTNAWAQPRHSSRPRPRPRAMPGPLPLPLPLPDCPLSPGGWARPWRQSQKHRAINRREKTQANHKTRGNNVLARSPKKSGVHVYVLLTTGNTCNIGNIGKQRSHYPYAESVEDGGWGGGRKIVLRP